MRFCKKQLRHEIEMKLILSSTYKDWKFSENTLAAKNLSNSPWEFGYALGFSRPLALKASAKRCFLGPKILRLYRNWKSSGQGSRETKSL